ncbi:Replication factor C, subunit RFC4, partial [Elasticomyces elasticus]
GLTLAVVVASLALEANDRNKGEGRWETVKVLDPDDPEHKNVIEKKIHHERYAGEDQWRDMIEAEEERIKEREAAIKAQEERDKKLGKAHKIKHKDSEHSKAQKEDKVNAP